MVLFGEEQSKILWSTAHFCTGQCMKSGKVSWLYDLLELAVVMAGLASAVAHKT